MDISIDESSTNRLRIAFARIARQLDRQSTQDGMTRTQLNVLGSVSRAKRIACSDLADIEGINPTMLSRILGGLEKSEYLRRIPSETDRRVIYAEITAQGNRAHLRMRRARTALLSAQISALHPEQSAALLAALPALEALAGLTEAAEVA